MSRVNTEFFLARRLAGRSGGRRNVMTTIATVTVAVSIAVMVVSLSVIMGFKREISGKLAGFGGHVQITALSGGNSLETKPILRDQGLEDALLKVKGVKNLSAYATKGGIIKTRDAMHGVMLKGVDADYDWSFFREHLEEGELPTVGGAAGNSASGPANDASGNPAGSEADGAVLSREIIVSRSLASLLKISTGDRVEMMFIQPDTPPRRSQFKITGIYNSGFEELDMMVVPTDIRNVQRIAGWDHSQITGYEADTYNFKNLERFTEDIYGVVSDNWKPETENLMVVNVKQRFPQMFDWLKAHDVNAAVIIIIMLLVALLNMISALLIILLERTRMIGVLKALGMNNPSLQKMFLIRSGYLIIGGMLWGNIVGIALCLVQKHTGLVTLDKTGYMLSEVPISLDWPLIAALNAGSFLLIVGLLAIPTLVISRIKPDTTIRYQ